MRTHLGNYFRQRRIDRGLSRGQLARQAGYKNISKGARRIWQLEEEGIVYPQLLNRLAGILEIDRQKIDELVEEERREALQRWSEWVNTPISPYIVVRLMPAVYQYRELPPEITSIDEAEAYACETARHFGREVWLVWSRRLSVHVNEAGETVARIEATPGEQRVPIPSMQLGGKGPHFLLDFGDGSPFRILSDS